MYVYYIIDTSMNKANNWQLTKRNDEKNQNKNKIETNTVPTAKEVELSNIEIINDGNI